MRKNSPEEKLSPAGITGGESYKGSKNGICAIENRGFNEGFSFLQNGQPKLKRL